MPKFAEGIADNIIEWVKREKTVLGEREYLDFLCAFDDWLEERV